jgi:hemerythrin superfamily protein
VLLRIIKERNMNIFEVLKRDHKTVSHLFKDIEWTTNKQVQVREQLFSDLKIELTIHSELEEKIFYSELREHPQTLELVSEAFDEHTRVKDLLEELAVMSKDGDEWMSRIIELKKNVDHHVLEEESEMFSWARQVLSQEQIEEMGLQMRIEKDKLLPLLHKAR